MVESGVPASSFAEAAHTAADITTVIAAVVVGVWAYARSYGQQIARPAIELMVNTKAIGEVASRSLIHVTFGVRNAGSRECKVFLCWKLTRLDAGLSSLSDVKYTDRRTHKVMTLHGQVRFARELPEREPANQTSDGQQPDSTTAQPGLVARDVQPLVPEFGETPPKFEPVLPYNTFVSAGVTQCYDFVTSVPLDCAAAVIVGYIQYQRPRSTAEKLLGGPVRAMTGKSRGETKEITSYHTTAGVLAMTPGSYPTEGPSG